MIQEPKPGVGDKTVDTLLITCPETTSSQGVKWGSHQLPVLTEYHYLFLEAPPKEHLADEMLAEIKIALQRGAKVVWFLTERTPLSTATVILGDTLKKIRPTPVGAAELLGEVGPLALPDSRISYVFTAANPWIPLGMWENIESAWLAARPSRSRGIEVVAPGPPAFTDDAIEAVKTTVDRLAAKTGPISAARRLMAAVISAALVLLLCVTVARYWQRSINLETGRTHYGDTALALHNVSWRTDSLVARLTPKEKGAPIESFFDGEQGNVVARLSFYRRMNLLGAHARLTQQIIAGTDQSQRDGLANYLSSLIYELNADDYGDGDSDNGFQLSPSSVDTARYIAQYYLNSVSALGDDSLTSRSAMAMYSARRIVDATRDNFLWASKEFQRKFAFREYEEPGNRKGIRSDYVDYVKTAKAASTWSMEQIDTGWQAYRKRWPQSPLAIDAEFNALRGYIESPTSTDQPQPIYDAARAFARNNPASPLADDAILYAWRFAISMADPQKIRESALLLQGKYGKSDSAAIMREVVGSALDQIVEVEGAFSTERARQLLLGPPDCAMTQSQEDLDVLYFLAYLAPRERSTAPECGIWISLAASRIAQTRGW